MDLETAEKLDKILRTLKESGGTPNFLGIITVPFDESGNMWAPLPFDEVKDLHSILIVDGYIKDFSGKGKISGMLTPEGRVFYRSGGYVAQLKQEKKANKNGPYVNVGRDVKNVNITTGDQSPISVTNINLDEKLEQLINLLNKHDIPQKEELIAYLKSEEIKKDKSKLIEVLGKVLSRGAEIQSIVTLGASILNILGG
jgi:hypothetical protein